MPPYLPDLTTLDYLKLTRGIDNTVDDAQLTAIIHEASAWFQRRCDRVFVPYFASEPYDALGEGVTARTLDVKDLLEVSSIVNGDGTTLAASDYVLRGSKTYPKWRIELLASSGQAWTFDDDYQDAITLNGTLGVHDQYPQAFRTIAQSTGTLNTTDDALAVSSSSGFETLQYLRLANGGELAQITAKATGTLTLERGVLGTTAVAQASATDVQAYQENPDVQMAATRLAGYLYEIRDSVAGRIQVADGAVLMDDAVPTAVMEVVHDREWKEFA